MFESLIGDLAFEPIFGLPFFDLGQYKLERLIGSSNHNVYLFEGPQQVAVKVVYIEDENQVYELQQTLTDLYLIQSTNHPNIIQLFGFCQTQIEMIQGKVNVYMIVMEYFPFNLHQRIKSATKALVEKQELMLALKSLVDAFAYLQEQQLSHCDIKPDNIITNSDSSPTIFKICDFDNLTQCAKNTRYQVYQITTYKYQAPEIREALNQGTEQFNYNAYKSDIYSMALTLGSMINQEHDVGSKIWIQQLFKILEAKFGQYLLTIFRKMLDSKNHMRPDFVTLKQFLDSEQDGLQLEKSLSISYLKFSHDWISKTKIESRQTIDMNYLVRKVLDGEKKLQSFRTLSSNSPEGLSRTMTPLAKFTKHQIDFTIPQRRYSEDSLSCSIDEVEEVRTRQKTQNKPSIFAKKQEF